MASGDTITDSLRDSLDTVVASARTVREHEGVMAIKPVTDRVTLAEGTGEAWKEISLSRLDDAFDLTETTELDNPQQMVDTALSITPTLVGTHTYLSDRVAMRISRKAFAQTGSLAQHSMQRKKDKDGLTILDSGVISAAVRRIQANATEHSTATINAVLHSYQVHDIDAELRSPVGTYEVTSGETAKAWRESFQGRVGGANVLIDNLITVDTGDDAKGGVFAQDSIVLVQGMNMKAVAVRNEKRGYGGTDMYYRDEYAFGIRISTALFEIYSDVTEPTS
jgi:hypothetical protein